MKFIILAFAALCTVSLASVEAYAQNKTPTRFSQRIEVPRNKVIQNLANNEDSPLLSSKNKGKSRYDRMQTRKNRNKASSNVNTTDSRTAGATNVNKPNKRKTGREIRADRAKVNGVVKDLLND